LLRNVLKGFVESPDALAVGEDFVRLSSAKFEPNRIEVTERIGLDLILPLAAMLPFERHMRWVEQKQVAAKVVEELLGGAGALAAVMGKVGKVKLAGPQARLLALLGRGVAAISVAAKLGGDQLAKMNSEALRKKDYMAAVLTRFRLDLDDGEEKRVLLMSKK
jgi:hypothetical protein